MYNHSSSTSSSGGASGPSTNTAESQQQKRSIPPWHYGTNNEPTVGWIPSWSNVSMDSGANQLNPILPPNQHWNSQNPSQSEHHHQASQRQPAVSTHQQSYTQPQDSIFPPPMNTVLSNTISTLPSPKGKAAEMQTPEKPDKTASTKRASASKATTNGHGKKKKRKVEVENDDHSVHSATEADKEKEKRTKTGRACDACRTKKIRCDILPSAETSSRTEDQPICAHCKQSNLECTFFLPITETRFKKKRESTRKESTPAPEQSSAKASTLRASKAGSESVLDHQPMASTAENEVRGGRVEGPTSIAFLLHTTIPSIQSEGFDLRNHSSWEVLEDGNGVIRVNAPPSAHGNADVDPDPTRGHSRLNKPALSGQTMSLLVNAYFKEASPLFPIISRAEFAAKTAPSPLLLYAICGVASTRRQFPREVFASVRGVLNGLLRSNDVLSDARFENVQALLLLAQVGDLHAQPTAATASASLIRTGAAIRMAQDLGLHRESAIRATGPKDLAYMELRRRVWATCVIMDRWYGAALGIPLLIDLLDCDVLLPAPYNILPHAEPSEWPIDTNFMALTEHLKLSIIIGRTLKVCYSPTGLKHVTDAQLEGIVDDMESWRAALPEELVFEGVGSSHVAALLHFGYTALQFLFWRLFTRITHSCPPHLTFSLELSHWSKMIKWSKDALEWLDVNDDALDTLFIFPYAATSCALIQYHTWARRGDSDSLGALKLVKETATKWENTVQPDQMSIRRKTCETMTLLYEAALKTDPDSQENHVPPKMPANPTPGVFPRQGGFGRVQFQKDGNRQGGGVFVADSEEDRNLSGVKETDVILSSQIPDSQNSRSAGTAQRSNPHRGPKNPEQGNLEGKEQTQLGNSRTGGGEVSDRQIQHPSNFNPQINQNGLQDGSSMGMGLNGNSIPQVPYSITGYNPGGMDEQYQLQNHHTGSSYGTLPNSNSNAPSSSSNTFDGPGYNNANGNGYGFNNNTFDPSFLDSLPSSSFDWDSWSTYFDKFLPAAANQSFENMP
ncbi:uncharacterized protein IL334_007725 [Kwoniella shivajii]|uniref:Zn(2)-C6 fungal-type domain-containing protein n=1 Tax=Kwoniella shivajii TaxID=564305 RepID=A0ABZ1DAV5_9TREE|nr:hypothetical protein IL334_007725 [Kwoniella shivajii]